MEARLRWRGCFQIGNVKCPTRSGFFAVAAQVMRHILVDYARGRVRLKRGSGVVHVGLEEEAATISDARVDEFIAIDTALQNLSSFDPRKGKAVEMRYFGGMTVDEVAEALRVARETVSRDWRIAKVWLRREIAQSQPIY